MQAVPASAAVISDFIERNTRHSQRPKALVSAIFRAIDELHMSHAHPPPSKHLLLRMWRRDLIIRRTTRPVQHRPSLPVKTVIRYIRSMWPLTPLSLEALRNRALALVVLAGLMRPSDAAAVRSVEFLDDCVILGLFNYKTDRWREGRRLSIPPATDARVCPVVCLQEYARRSHYRQGSFGPLFRKLGSLDPLRAPTISGILRRLAIAAGVPPRLAGGGGWRSGAVIAGIRGGIPTATLMKQGGWKSADVFHEHYAHVLPDNGFTDTLLAVDCVSPPSSSSDSQSDS